MSTRTHLIVEDHPQSGAWNMAFDEALLNRSLATGEAFVRMYRWSEATVSLGYFQNEAERNLDPRLATLPCVRRLSGGGAILHHHEQTYSCCLPPQHPLAEEPYRLYEQVHAAVIELLGTCGVELLPRGRNDKSQPEPFLCFLREAAPDLVFRGHKVLGSAQRRRKGAVLQHGSLLLRRSEHVPEIPGISDLAAEIEWTDALNRQWGERLAEIIGPRVISDGTISEISAEVADRLAEAKFSAR